MSKEAFESCMKQYKASNELSSDDYAQLTEDEASKLAHEIMSNMSVESKDMFIIEYFIWAWKFTKEIKLFIKGAHLTKEG